MGGVSRSAPSPSEARVPPGIYSVPDPSSPLSNKFHESHTGGKRRKRKTFGQLCEISPLDHIVRLQEDLSQPGLPDRIVLQVEFVEPVERVLVRVHVQGIDRKIVCTETQGSEYFGEGQVFPVSEDHNILLRGEKGDASRKKGTNVGGTLHLRFDESQQMLLVHTAGMVDVGINLADVVKVPRTRTVCESRTVLRKGVKYLCGPFCSNFVSPQERSRACNSHLHVGNFLILVQEVVHVKFAR